MVNHFTKNRVWEILGHTLSWPKSVSNYSSTKDYITSLKPRTWKNTLFLRRNATFELKTNYCLFSHTRAMQSSNLWVLNQRSQDHWAFGTTVWHFTMSCLPHLRCQYKCSSGRRATFPTRKIKSRSSPVFEAERPHYLFKPKIHKVTWLLICNLKVIFKNLRRQYKHLFQREDFAFGHEETCLHNNSSHCQAWQFRVFSLSGQIIFLFFSGKAWIFLVEK